jgi:predicted secreted hydrolase
MKTTMKKEPSGRAFGGFGRVAPVLGAALLALPLPHRGGEWSVPRAGQALAFPRDHGSHPDFKIEWWYLTGHLFAGERRLGFQATFFRLGRQPLAPTESEAFAGEQLFLAHMGLSDPAGGVFLHEERLNRAGWDAASAEGDLDLFNGNWSLRRDPSAELGPGRIALLLEGGIRAEASLSLRLEAEKDLVVFGEDGISRKGPEGTAASYYLTFPRLRAEGLVRIGGQSYEVEGEAWMDHEISSSQLDEDQIGWDWTCVQFFDGRELMGYVLRTVSGPPSPWSRLVWIDGEGALVHQAPDSYQWRHEGSWKSPETGAVYPVSPLIVAADPASGEERRLRLLPLMPAQEIVGRSGGVSYWEGACDVRDEGSGEIVGRAFLEMTGYAGGVAERLR